MTKAAVVIGVDKTGDLPLLNDAASGADRVTNWLKREGYETVLLTDKASGTEERKPVVANDIFTTIDKFIRASTVEQLVIYFSGHGFIKDGTEHWLLSQAPGNPNEAVNLEENILLARDCGSMSSSFPTHAARQCCR
jgi:hypothetical protein